MSKMTSVAKWNWWYLKMCWGIGYSTSKCGGRRNKAVKEKARYCLICIPFAQKWAEVWKINFKSWWISFTLLNHPPQFCGVIPALKSCMKNWIWRSKRGEFSVSFYHTGKSLKNKLRGFFVLEIKKEERALLFRSALFYFL